VYSPGSFSFPYLFSFRFLSSSVVCEISLPRQACAGCSYALIVTLCISPRVLCFRRTQVCFPVVPFFSFPLFPLSSEGNCTSRSRRLALLLRLREGFPFFHFFVSLSRTEFCSLFFSTWFISRQRWMFRLSQSTTTLFRDYVTFPCVVLVKVVGRVRLTCPPT